MVMAFGDTYDLNAEGQYTFDDQQRIVPPRPVPRPTPAPAAPSDEEKVRAAKEWMARYLKSPMFAQRMAQTVKDEGWDKRNAANYSQILQGNLQDVQADYVPGGFFNTLYRMAQGKDNPGGSRYYDQTAFVVGPQAKESNTTVDELATHEFAHSLEDKFAVPPRQQAQIRALQTEDPRANKHVRDPEEARADVYAIRNLASRLGVYDAGTQVFTPQHLAKIEQAVKSGKAKSYSLQRMLEVYGPDGLVKLMNMIAQQNANQIPDNYA